MSKQTAVEWLIDNLPQRFKNAMLLSSKEIIEQAKAMERDQIVEAWDNGFANGYDLGKYDDNCNPDDAEQYYNETYGGEEAKQRAANYMMLKGALDDSKGGEE